MDIRTGQKKYNPCNVCGGTGTTSDEKAYYSEFPDISLQNAGYLIKEKGKPKVLEILGDHEFCLHFRDGSKFLLGGFTVGYRGTGPEYTLRLLIACGFNFNYDDVVAMKPPITFAQGAP